MERIEKYSRNEIRFNLLAVIENRMDILSKDLEKANSEKATLKAKLDAGDTMEVDGQAKVESAEDLRKGLELVENTITR